MSDELTAASIHEAGHAVVARACGMYVNAVRLDRNGAGATRTAPSGMFILRLPILEMCRRRIVTSMSGAEAEYEIYGEPEHSNDTGDRENIMALLDAHPILGAELTL
jgi:hypothetical protein